MYKRIIAYILFFFLAVFVSLPTFSMPAYPHLITLIQPGGEAITLRMRGDEKMKWMESEDGYSLLYDKDKNIVYATLDENGNMVPSELKVTNVSTRSSKTSAELNAIPKGLQYSEEQRQTFFRLWEIKEDASLRSSQSSASTIGTAKAICALIRFSDKPFTKTVADFEILMNQVGYSAGTAKGSVKDFYLENSYGQLALIVTVVGTYTASKNWAYYGANGAGGNDSHANELAREAANFAFNESSVNPADYDNDGDGYIDTFHFLYAGYGEEAGGGDDCIWAHKSGFYSPLTFSGKKLDTYSCSPELRGNSGTIITSVGPICHELCHVFGAPDFYDADGDGSGGDFLGTGNWDLMAGGSWNSNGDRPAHINMYQKIQFGWVNPVELSAKQTITDMPNSAENPTAYIIKTSVANEYYVLENRQKKGFDANVPGHGLLIYHVSVTQQNINWNTVNNGHPQRVYPVCASARDTIPTATLNSYGSINSSGCVFSSAGLSPRRAFTDFTAPAMRTWNGGKVSKPITEVIESGGLISFKFMDTGLSFSASVEGLKVTLTWITPVSEKEIAGYNLYRDDVFFLFTNQNITRNTVPQTGVYKYGISIKYADGTESGKEEIEVNVTTTAINTVEKSAASIYPNPVEQGGMLTLNLGDTYDGKAELFIYEVSGQLIMRTSLSSSVTQYPMNLSRGMYFLKIVKGKATETFKINVK